MEQNPCVDPSSQQFRQQLNQWFEQHGVLDNLRSHLRSVMITALQQTEIRLKPNQKTTPKMQSVNLLIAEYLMKHGCHYTLSVLMSELPALSNFASGAILFHCRTKTEEKSKSREKYRFKESEIIEILNSLGVSSYDENLKLICECYSRNKEEESLLECLLRFITKVEPVRIPNRCASEARNEAQVSGVVKNAGESPQQGTARRFHAKMSDGELKRAVEEENERRMRELIEREKRIQVYLKSHEDEMVQRLRLAEEELNSRRETIDRELSERQLHLGRIAFQLRDKHNEIVELSRNFAAIKSENITLNAKLDSVQVELNELREELEKKTGIIERLEAERMSMKCHVQEYLKWKTGEGTDREAVTSSFHDGAHRKNVVTKEAIRSVQNLNSGSSQEGSPSSDESCGEALLDRVKARVEMLDHENARICEKYLKYKKKYESEIEVSEMEEPPVTVAVQKVECVTEPEASVEPAGQDGVFAVHKEEVEACRKDVEETMEITPRKKVTVEEEKRVLVPTKRQQKNLEYYLQSRNLLEALEKTTGFMDGSASGSTSDVSICCSWSSRIEAEEGVTRVPEKAKIQESVPIRGRDTGMRDLSDSECLNILKEATRPLREQKMEAPAKEDDGS